jgi:hypothetical protein
VLCAEVVCEAAHGVVWEKNPADGAHHTMRREMEVACEKLYSLVNDAWGRDGALVRGTVLHNFLGDKRAE